MRHDHVWEAATNEEYVDRLCEHHYIDDDKVKEVFLKVDRAHYAPTNPYENKPQSIGFWAVISAPGIHTSAIRATFTHSVPTEANPKRRILDVGSGSGYTTHLLAEMAGPEGIVVGIEHIQQLRDMGERNFNKTDRGKELLEKGNVAFIMGDAREGGVNTAVKEGIRGIDSGTKWDVIHVAACSDEVPEKLMNELKAPGCMFIPLDFPTEEPRSWPHKVWKIEKDEQGNVERTVIHEEAYYVLLTDPPKDSALEVSQPRYGFFNYR